MKTVELSDDTYAALERVAKTRNLTMDELLSTLLRERSSSLDADALLVLLESPAFRALSDATERYLALLAWCAGKHASDFADFISHQESAHRYLMLSRDEIREVRAHNHARQIDGTQFWAVMTIDASSKRRFVRRLLEFIGCRDVTVIEACGALGLATHSEQARLRGVA
jgi:hypothetical protein